MGNKKGEVLRIKGDVVTLFLEELGAKICVSLSQVNKI